MKERFHFPKCHLNIGQHKTIDTDVQLEVATWEDDDYADPDPNDKPENYIDGVRSQGELSFDAYPLGWNSHPVKKNAVGQLTIRDGNDTTKLNVVFIQQNGEQTVIKDRIKRYFWLFFVIGKPISDGLELFPYWQRGQNVNKLFTCTDFRGIWPVGVSSLVIARDQVQAKKLLVEALQNAGINQPEVNDLTLQEVDLKRSHALVLNKGDY